MTFLERLRHYLAQTDPPEGVEPNLRAHRAHVVKRLIELERAGCPDEQVERSRNHLNPTRLDRFVRALTDALLDDFGQSALPEEIAAWIDVALDRKLHLDASTGSKVRDRELDRLVQTAWDSAWYFEEDEEVAAAYLGRILAIRPAGKSRIVTPIGRLIQELPDKDAHRWILAAEVVQSDGPKDLWRLSWEGAFFLLHHPTARWDFGEGSCPWQVSLPVLSLLSKKGLIETHDANYGSVVSYQLLPQGRPLLEEVASNNETPFTLLVRALLQDETAAIVDSARPSAVSVIRESSADATARHARMVAHEIRNALVPVQSAVESLYRDLDREGKGAIAEKRRAGIDGGIERIFRFLQDISSIANLASTPSDLFDIAGPVNEAIAVIASDTGLSITFDAPLVLPPVKGHRDRFSLALVNVLRNAVQSRSREGLQIKVSAGTRNGAEVYVAIDDNGPGVPPEHRASIFEPGFSLRAQGSGQGLALVREVIESEMAGRAVCEQSDLGGARIVLRLPVGSKRKQ